MIRTRDLCRTGAYKRINRSLPVSTDRFNTTEQASHNFRAINEEAKNMGEVRKFRWTTEMMEKLNMCIKRYKARMQFQGLDFDGDRSAYTFDSTSIKAIIHVIGEEIMTKKIIELIVMIVSC